MRAFILALFAVLLVASVQAIDYTYSGPDQTETPFEEPTNWSPPGVPGPNDKIIFPPATNGAYLKITGTVTVNSVDIEHGSTTPIPPHLPIIAPFSRLIVTGHWVSSMHSFQANAVFELENITLELQSTSDIYHLGYNKHVTLHNKGTMTVRTTSTGSKFRARWEDRLFTRGDPEGFVFINDGTININVAVDFWGTEDPRMCQFTNNGLIVVDYNDGSTYTLLGCEYDQSTSGELRILSGLINLRGTVSIDTTKDGSSELNLWWCNLLTESVTFSGDGWLYVDNYLGQPMTWDNKVPSLSINKLSVGIVELGIVTYTGGNLVTKDFVFGWMNFFDGATTARPLTEYVVETDNMYMRNNGNYDIGPANLSGQHILVKAMMTTADPLDPTDIRVGGYYHFNNGANVVLDTDSVSTIYGARFISPVEERFTSKSAKLIVQGELIALEDDSFGGYSNIRMFVSIEGGSISIANPPNAPVSETDGSTLVLYGGGHCDGGVFKSNVAVQFPKEDYTEDISLAGTWNFDNCDFSQLTNAIDFYATFESDNGEFGTYPHDAQMIFNTPTTIPKALLRRAVIFTGPGAMTIDNMGWAGGQIHGDAPFTLNYLYVDLITHGLISVDNLFVNRRTVTIAGDSSWNTFEVLTTGNNGQIVNKGVMTYNTNCFVANNLSPPTFPVLVNDGTIILRNKYSNLMNSVTVHQNGVIKGVCVESGALTKECESEDMGITEFYANHEFFMAPTTVTHVELAGTSSDKHAIYDFSAANCKFDGKINVEIAGGNDFTGGWKPAVGDRFPVFTPNCCGSFTGLEVIDGANHLNGAQIGIDYGSSSVALVVCAAGDTACLNTPRDASQVTCSVTPTPTPTTSTPTTSTPTTSTPTTSTPTTSSPSPAPVDCESLPFPERLFCGDGATQKPMSAFLMVGMTLLVTLLTMF